MKAIAGVFGLVLLTCVTGQPLSAVQHCVTQDFNGTYGLVAHGAVTVPGFPITGPFARAGQAVADGRGKLVFNTTASYNGILFNESINATYTMSPDCSMVFTVQPFAPIFQLATFQAFLSDNKRQVDFIITVPLGQAISAVLRKQEERGCNERDLSGSFVLHMTGSVLSPSVAPFVRVGKFTADGFGHFFAQTTANYGGVSILPEDLLGTYDVARDCSVTMRYTFQNTQYNWTGSLVDNGKGATLIVTNPGVAIAGTLTEQ